MSATELLILVGLSCSIGGILIGMVLLHVFKSNGNETRFISNRTDKSTLSLTMPILVFLFGGLAFTVGIAIILRTKIKSNKEESKDGIRYAIGTSWGLFMFSIIAISYLVESAKISDDSKFYLISSLIVLYFAILAMILIYFDRIYKLPTEIDKIDMMKTNNTFLIIFTLIVLYGVFGILYM